MNNIVKIALCVLLLLCLIDMPYGYYQFVRFVSFAIFAYFALDEYSAGNKKIAYLYVAIALLFQPFFKISLGRDIWNVVDVIVALSLIVSISVKKNIET